MPADQAHFRVVVDGLDISERLNPILIKLSVHDASGTASDTATIEIDDTNGRIALPREGAYVVVSLGWRSSGIARVFEGTVNDVRSHGSRGGGRTIVVTAKSADMKGKPKQPQERHWDKKPLSTVLEEAGHKAGISNVIVDSELGSIMRDYWSMNAESFFHFGHRLSREIGGTFKIMGRTAVMAKRNGGLSASGRGMGTVTAQWGVNLINWDISPILSRPRYKEMRARWWDDTEAKWKEEKLGVEDAGAQAQATIRYTRRNADEAKQATKNGKADAERNKGGGSVRIIGNPQAQPEGLCVVIGARPGVDGTYRIDAVDHELDRGSGYTTSLSLKHPEGDAGKDGRRSKST